MIEISRTDIIIFLIFLIAGLVWTIIFLIKTQRDWAKITKSHKEQRKMKISIDEAIEIMEKEEEDTWMGDEEKWKAAVKLSYEALKREKHNRQYQPFLIFGLLPGETEE